MTDEDRIAQATVSRSGKHMLVLAQIYLAECYARWCSLAKRSHGTLSAWDGCLSAVFTDPHGGDLASADLLSGVLHSWAGFPTLRDTYLADLAVRADQLQAAGDPRGLWLAIWLMPPSEHRDRAVIDSTPALAQHMERLIAEHERRARRTKTIPRKGPWSIESGSMLVLRIDGGPDQVVTFRAGDFVDTQVVLPHELAAVIDEQLAGAYAVPASETVEIESAAYDGKVEIVGGSAARNLGIWRLFDPTLFNVDYGDLERRIFTMHGRGYGRSEQARLLGERLHTGRLQGNSFDIAIFDDVTPQRPRYGMTLPRVTIYPPSVQVAAQPSDDAALAKMCEAFAAFATRRSPVSAEVSAITDPSESRDP